jgi:hypothetical protein
MTTQEATLDGFCDAIEEVYDHLGDCSVFDRLIACARRQWPELADDELRVRGLIGGPSGASCEVGT